jgi:hypothetical protein
MAVLALFEVGRSFMVIYGGCGHPALQCAQPCEARNDRVGAAGPSVCVCVKNRSRPPDLLILGASKRRTDRWSQGADRRHGMAGLNHQGHNTAADDVPRDKE